MHVCLLALACAHQNFLFKSKSEDSPLKAVDFGLSDFRKPGEGGGEEGAEEGGGRGEGLGMVSPPLFPA